ncbi:hypothetical protein TRFO_37520 [Tritrichomonas foetus]|uniref:Glycosyltransferase 2-like domain-containing protein n=1 Tax=Tritrichomonas foetus TaxID=1144522 RepID=A0A1J4JCB4_9EUKA|nr:hypothetical protein TRFO_37520 [Tritrichomonas foetus]|eukprot:OHS96305.1 hypothetical protein TRFO_37520 [Tritrichomonas foetus]
MPLLPVHAKSTRIPLAEFYFFAIITIASFFYAYLDTSYSTDGDVSYPDINQGIYNSSSPYLTIATMPFRVNSMKVVNELLTSISSWLRLDDSIVVHLYDIVGGMGNQSDLLINKLQEIWGSDRVFVRGTIVREMHAETIPQIFEQVEREAKSPLVAYINNDMILDPDFMKYLRSTATFFGKYNNWSFHVSRTNLNNTCRELVNYSVIQSPEWPEKFNEIKEKYFEKTQVYGYDVFLWNRLGISMKKAKIPKFLIGRPFFEYSVIAGIKRQGWFITGFPTLLSFHISHPGRLSFQFKKNTSDFIYCEKLHLKSRDMSVRNIDINLRINETYVTIFHKPRDILPNTTFTTFPVQHYLVNPLLYLDKKLF